MSENQKSFGFKTLTKMTAMVLSTIWTLFNMFFVWLPASATGITVAHITTYGVVLVIILFIYVLLIYLMDFMHVVFYKIKEYFTS